MSNEDFICHPSVHEDIRNKSYQRGYEEGAKAERERMLKLFQEIENGISTYEKENEHQLVRDACRGVYIPTNVVRRLIAVRKEKLLKRVDE